MPTIFAKRQTTNEIIQEIHDTFYSEVDRLLEGTKVYRELQTEQQSLIDKAARLSKLGFGHSKEVQEANAQIAIINEKKKVHEAIIYFQQKYPQYKFITEDSVNEICNKYGLIYGDVYNYTGTVPEKNLKQIEDFSIQSEDKCYQRRFIGGSRSWKPDYVSNIEAHPKYTDREKELRMHIYNNHYSYSEDSLTIAAPKSDFNMEGMELKGNKLSKIEIPDPIVLQPVFHGGARYFLIVTAWGLEASDELVVNQKMN